MYLLDTDVLSELRKRRMDRNVVAWIESVPSSGLFLSTVTTFEIEVGIERRQRDNPAFAQDLASWFEAVLNLYGDRILPVTVNIARRWGRLAVQIGNKNLDGALAATALEHGLTVATRNVAHYAATGVAIANPFETETPKR